MRDENFQNGRTLPACTPSIIRISKFLYALNPVFAIEFYCFFKQQVSIKLMVSQR